MYWINSMHTDWIVWVFGSFNCDDFGSHLTKTHQFTISTNYNMVTCQSANQLKTPAKVSWAFKMVSQFGSLGYTIMGKTADLTVVQKTIIDTLHKEGEPQTCIAKEAVHRVLYPSMLTESWVEDLNYFSLCALNIFNTWVSQFELNYWNKWTFLRHSNLLRCTCMFV